MKGCGLFRVRQISDDGKWAFLSAPLVGHLAGEPADCCILTADVRNAAGLFPAPHSGQMTESVKKFRSSERTL